MSDHEMPDEAPPKIKVTDRRMFDADGNLRDDVVADSAADPAEAPAAEAAPPAEPASEPAPPSHAEAQSDPQAEAPGAAPSEPPTESPGTESASADLANLNEEALMRFIEEQYIGGLLALGAMPEPQTGQVMEDLPLAQVRIEMLGLVREQAGESLSAEARKGVDDVLYQLRMAYLQKSKVAKL